MAVELGGEQNEAFSALSFAQMLAELRKFGVGMARAPASRTAEQGSA